MARRDRQSTVIGQQVTLRVEGADTVTVDGDTLRLSSVTGDLTLPLLAAEHSNTQRANVARVNGQAFDVTAPFALAPAKSAMPTPVGPVVNSPQSSGLPYATFLGGSHADWGFGLALDSAGQAYVAGCTYSADFPADLGPGYDTTHNGAEADGFVVKLDMPPWASWTRDDRPLLVPPAGAAVVVDYGNMTPPVTLAAQVTGAALFDSGGGGTTSINTTLPDGNGSYAMRLIPASGATAGQALSVQVDIGPVTLTKDGWIARQVWLPLILRR